MPHTRVWGVSARPSRHCSYSSRAGFSALTYLILKSLLLTQDCRVLSRDCRVKCESQHACGPSKRYMLLICDPLNPGTRRIQHTCWLNDLTKSYSTGAIILASVVVAVGIAVYESPEVRRWIEQYRRKIAIALHSLGDDIQPRRPSESSEDFAARRELRRQEIIRQQRNELVRRAREEGVAVDLDELSRIGLDLDNLEMEERGGRSRTNISQRSFDELVDKDGRIRDGEDGVKASGILLDDSEANLRRRGMAGFAAGSAAGAALDPFSDDNMIIFDHDDDSRQSSQTIRDTSLPAGPAPHESDLIDLHTSSDTRTLQLQCPEGVDAEFFAALPAEIQQEVVEMYEEQRAEKLLKEGSLLAEEKTREPVSPQSSSQTLSDNAPQSQADSFYSIASSTATAEQAPAMADSQPELLGELTDDDDMIMSTGTLTPQTTQSHLSDYSALTADSLAGHANESSAQSMMDESDTDARSEAWSEAGFTDAGHSDAGNNGIMTPSSWTDVGSDEEGSEWNGQAGAVHVQHYGGQTH